MERTLLLDKNENVRQVEAEEQSRFIFSIIENLGIPFEFDPDKPMTTIERIQMRKTLSDYNISVIDDLAGNVKIYLDRDLIAEWHKARYCLREDRSQLDPKKRLYIEMLCHFESKLDIEENKEAEQA